MTPTIIQPRRRRFLAVVLALTLLLWLVPGLGATAPGDFVISQLTVNGVREHTADIDGDRVVWLGAGGSDGGTDDEVFTWKLGDAAPTQVTQNGVSEYPPRISGDRLVWYSPGGSDAGSDGEIFTWTPSLGIRQLTENGAYDSSASVSGDRVVWRAADQMFTWTPTEGVTPIPATSTNNQYLAVSEDRTVWSGVSGTDGGVDLEIFTWKVGDATPTQVTENDDYDTTPRLSGDRLVWYGSGGSDGGTDREIFTWHVGDATPRQVTRNDTSEDAPAVSGDHIAWTAFTTDGGTDREIFSWTVGQTAPIQVTTNSIDEIYPQVSGDRVIWANLTSASDPTFTWTWRIGDAAPTQVGLGGSAPGPMVSGDRIVWAGPVGADSGTDDEIFTAIPSSSQSRVSVSALMLQSPASLSFTMVPGIIPQGGSITAGSLNFGQLTPEVAKTASHLLSVTTNAASGYSVTAEEDSALQSGANIIVDTVGDDGSVTETIAGLWALSSTYGFGHMLVGPDAASSGYRQFADVSRGEAPQAVMGNPGPVTSSSVELMYKLNVGATQAPGTYTNTITYIATGNF